MPGPNTNILVVEDQPLLRELVSGILAEAGYRVRSAEDGFSALAEIRKEIPNIILSDLYMPGMSGFEFLSVVRRRFPEIQVIAMSGAFSGNSVPPGVAADAFYAKGNVGNMSVLLQIVEAMTHRAPSPLQRSGKVTPIWIAKNGHDASGGEFVMVTCPECLRVFPQPLTSQNRLTHEACCVNCFSTVHFAIVQSEGMAPPPPGKFQSHPGTRKPVGTARISDALGAESQK